MVNTVHRVVYSSMHSFPVFGNLNSNNNYNSTTKFFFFFLNFSLLRYTIAHNIRYCAIFVHTRPKHCSFRSSTYLTRHVTRRFAEFVHPFRETFSPNCQNAKQPFLFPTFSLTNFFLSSLT